MTGGSASDQQALVTALDRYEHAERLSQAFPSILVIGQAADQRHQEMFSLALRCGFDPAHDHMHLTPLTWARRRVDLIKAVLPNHVGEVK